MSQQIDAVILVVYLICVVYVFYQAIDSLEDQAAIQFDRPGLNAQLEEKQLAGRIDIQVRLKSVYQFEQLYDLSLMVQNNFPNTPVYIDWDVSSLADFTGRSRRVIRIPPSMTMDLSQPQIFSVIAPGNILSERITAEDILRRRADSDVLEIAAPLIDLSIARNLPEDKSLPFSLRLVLRIPSATGQGEVMATYALVCRFAAKRLPWSRSLPWKQWFKQ